MTTDEMMNEFALRKDFGGEDACTYASKCKGCGRIVEVSTQKDDGAEYITHVFVRCTCGLSVGFDLPVN